MRRRLLRRQTSPLPKKLGYPISCTREANYRRHGEQHNEAIPAPPPDCSALVAMTAVSAVLQADLIFLLFIAVAKRPVR